MTRWPRAAARASAAGALLAAVGCQAARVLTNQCTITHVGGSAALTVSAGGTERAYALAGEGARNGAPGRDPLLQALVAGAALPDTGVTWALASSGGARLVVTHHARLRVGDRLQVSGPPARRDWDAHAAPAPGAAAAVLELGAIASQLAGTIEITRVAPLELRVDLHGGSAVARVTGTVRFRGVSADRPCFS